VTFEVQAVGRSKNFKAGLAKYKRNMKMYEEVQRNEVPGGKRSGSRYG
jgi:hypothetical protein